MQNNVTILCPLYNDGESLNRLLIELAKTFSHLKDYHFNILIVNDGSTEEVKINNGTSFQVQVLHLQRNIGHQKALAIGLSYIKENISSDKVLIMDTDGEDRPEDALELLQAAEKKNNDIIFAHRSSRREDLLFKLF